MSYILDALRKSEQQRRRAGAPDLTTEHEPVSTGGGRQRLLLATLVLALVGNAAALGVWWFRSGDDRREPPPATRIADPPPEPIVQAGENGKAVGQTAAAPMREEAATITTLEGDPEADSGSDKEPAAMDPAAEPVSIHALPERIRVRIPSLRFSTHIYAEEGAWREVGINGRIHAEGARFQGMQLERITETGVILELDGWRFRVSVLENWDY